VPHLQALYAEDCEFADPFASFRGKARFKGNLENLAGGFIAENDVKLLQPLALETAGMITLSHLLRMVCTRRYNPLHSLIKCKNATSTCTPFDSSTFHNDYDKYCSIQDSLAIHLPITH
jgi:hypothetical protein